jgi:hypothetical protein
MKTIAGLSVSQPHIMLILVWVFIIGSVQVAAQNDTLSNGKAFNFPFKKYGISIGNSREYNGIRINYADKNVKRINGLNITCWYRKSSDNKNSSKRFLMSDAPNKSAIVNGVTVGVTPVAGTMQPFNLLKTT